MRRIAQRDDPTRFGPEGRGHLHALIFLKKGSAGQAATALCAFSADSADGTSRPMRIHYLPSSAFCRLMDPSVIVGEELAKIRSVVSTVSREESVTRNTDTYGW
jgi:hypothetical protein